MNDERYSPLANRLSRRSLLKGLAASTGVVLLAACGREMSGETSGSTGGAATTAGAGTAPTAATGAAVTTTAGGAAPTAAGGTSPTQAAGGAVTTVTWYAGRDTTGWSVKQVEAFNAQSQNIKIDYQEQGATTDDLRNKFVTVATAKDPSADIVSMDVPFVPEFAAAGWTIPMEDYLPQSERAAFFKGTIDGATYKNKLYAIPWFNNGPALFYRKDLLEGAGLPPPKSYDQLVEAARKLQTPEVNGYILQTVQNEGGMISWLEMLWAFGGALVDDNLNTVVDKGTAGVQSMQRLVDWLYKDKIVPESTLTMRTSGDAANAFAAGRGVFLRMWMSQLSVMDAQNSQIRGKWDLTTLPSLDGTKPGPGCLGTWNLGISMFSKKQKEAAEAIKFLTSQEQQKRSYLDGGRLPARSAVFDDPDIKAKYPFSDKLKPSFEALKPRPVTPYYGQMSLDAIQPNFGSAVSRQKSPEQAIKDMAARMKEISGQ